MKYKTVVAAVAVTAILSWAAPNAVGAQQKGRFGYLIEYLPGMESNIYHSYSDSDETSAVVNVVAGAIEWSKKPRRGFRQDAALFAEMEWYPSYSSRNQSSLGVAYEPSYKYARKGKLSAKIVFSRRNKDLVDDQGQDQTRILQKWQTDLTLDHAYGFGRWEFEQRLYFNDDNYDETDTVDPSGVVSTLRSYDYHSYGGRLQIGFEFERTMHLRMTVQSEKRKYDERRTYTVKYGAYVGRPFEIREFVENTMELQYRWRFFGDNSLRLEVSYARRTDNFENFYGLDQLQYKAVVSLVPARRHRTDISFRFKDKDYEHYWTSRIGRASVVAIDYADFQLEHWYQLTADIAIELALRNYNKVSNDSAFDYHDFNLGLGFRISR